MSKRQRTPEEPQTRPSPYVPSEKYHTRVGQAFRISNIPSDITMDQFFQILGSLPSDSSSNDGQSNVLGWSFAPAAACADSGLHSTATVTFKSVPTIFQFECLSRSVSLVEHLQSAIVDKHFYGLPLSDSGQQTTVDIFAVTGLAGHAFGLWKARNGTAMWLRDFLPEYVPTARIMTYGYDSTLVNSDSTASIREFSQNFLEALSTVRRANSRRPIIFIGHSLGGLALMEATKSSDQRRAIFESCYALLLFGVPNKGLEVERLRDMVKGQPNSQLIEDLDSSSEFLRRHNFFGSTPGPETYKSFQCMKHDLPLLFRYCLINLFSVLSWFLPRLVSPYAHSYELKISGVWTAKGPKVMIVSRESAIWATPKGSEDDIFSINADHSEITKFTDSTSHDYLNEAPSVIHKRFEELQLQQQGGSLPRATSSIESMYIQFRGEAEERKQCKILKWLSRIEYMHHHQIALEGIVEGTGGWLLEKEEFRRWRYSNVSSILWLHGIPGAGKTKLTCIVIETIGSPLQQSKTHQTCEPVIFFYCNQGDSKRRDPTAILQALVKQISRALPGLPKAVVTLYDKTEDPMPLNFQGCHDMLVSLLDIFPRTTIIIDALDESDLIERGRLLESSARMVKIFISSRDDVDIQLQLDKLPNLYIEAQDNREDIKRFINREMADSIKNSRLALLPVETRAKIVSALVNKAGGMFQWVNLQIPYLNAMCFEEDIIDSLGKLLRTLKATYSQILAPMREGTPREWAVTVRALMWMISSQMPLTQQLWAELTYWPDAVPTHGVTKLFELCRYLVTSNGQSEDVSFAHLSVREYLETEFNPEDSNSMAAECCLSILDSTSLHVFPHSRDDWPELANYAVRYWPDHLDRSYRGMEHMSRPLLDHLKRFLGPSAVPGQSYCRWTSMLLLFDSSAFVLATPPNPLLVACYFKFGEELHDMFACNDLDIESTNDWGHTLPHVAIIGGNDRVVNILLNVGANPHALVGDQYRNPLDLAFKGSNMRAIDVLLNNGANHGWNTNILVAAARDSAGLSVMVWLINREPCVKITESVFTELVGSCERHGGLFSMLLARAPYLEINEAVARALSGRDHLIVLLLDRNPQPNITEAGLAVLLRSASMKSISKLLAREPPIKITEAMVAAAFQGSPEILQMFLATDPHIKVTGAVLAAAAAGMSVGREQVMRVLMAWDPNFEITLPTVMKLQRRWSRDIVSSLVARVPNMTEGLLLDNMHDTEFGEMETNMKTDALVRAAAANQGCGIQVMVILLPSASKFNLSMEALIAAVRRLQSVRSARSAHGASAHGASALKVRLMKLLLARDQNIEIREGPLLDTLADWNDEMMGMLLDRDPSIRVSEEDLLAGAQNGGGEKMAITEQLLLSVAEYHNVRVMEMLLVSDPSIRITDEHLLAVVKNWVWGVPVMKILLAGDRNIIITDKLLGHCGPQMCEVLLARDPNILITEEVLLGALEEKDHETIELLLAHDRNLQVTEVVLLLAFGIHFVDEYITILLPRATGIEITERLLIAALRASYDDPDCLPKTIHCLLQARGLDVGITEAVVVAAVGMDGAQLLMKILLSRDPNILTTEAVMVAAAGNDFEGREMVKVLLSRNPDIGISAEVMAAAVGNHGFGGELVMVLLERDLNIEIEEDWGVRLEMVAARTFGSEWVTIVIPKNPNMPAALIAVKRDFEDD
ncbi:hypothetical protein Q9L58_009624, partial [Maublancomyces gigas]